MPETLEGLHLGLQVLVMWTLELELHGHWYRVAALGELGCTVGPVLSLWAAGLECGTAAAD